MAQRPLQPLPDLSCLSTKIPVSVEKPQVSLGYSTKTPVFVEKCKVHWVFSTKMPVSVDIRPDAAAL